MKATTIIIDEAMASPDLIGHWHDIDWASCHKKIRRLQARIVKVVAEGRWRMVKKLQQLLTRSFSARAIAVKRVTENKFESEQAGLEKQSLKGLSRMRGNDHVRFLGEGKAVMSSSNPIAGAWEPA